VARRVAREEEASPSGLKRPGILVWVVLIVVAIVALWPMYWLYITAFTPTLDTVKTPPDLIPIHASLANFSRLFPQAKDYWRWALNSLIISLSVTAFHLLFDTMEKRWPIESIRLVHRVGLVKVTEPSLWVEAIAPHRGEAFAACQWLIDEMKRVVPIWKKPVS